MHGTPETMTPLLATKMLAFYDSSFPIETRVVNVNMVKKNDTKIWHSSTINSSLVYLSLSTGNSTTVKASSTRAAEPG